MSLALSIFVRKHFIEIEYALELPILLFLFLFLAWFFRSIIETKRRLRVAASCLAHSH